MHACLFNLIFYTQKTERAAYIRTIAQKVIAKFPSRVIFVTNDKEAKRDSLKTEMSELSSGQGEYAVTCDLFQIDVSGKEEERVPFLILPQLISDLPVYLVWGEDVAGDSFLVSQLENAANRLIFDSECTDNLSRFSTALLKRKESSHADIADLNWARTESWRCLLTELFSNSETLRASQSIQLTYNGHSTPFFSHTSIQSLYLQAWLASRMGWAFKKGRKDKNTLVFNYQKPQGEVEVSLLSADYPGLSPGMITAFNLTTQNGVSFSCTRNVEAPHQVTVNISDKEKCEIPLNYLFAKSESGNSLVREICHKGTSEHYLKVLDLITKIDSGFLC